MDREILLEIKMVSNLLCAVYYINSIAKVVFLGTKNQFFIKVPGNSVIRFLPIDPLVSGSTPTSAKLSLRVRRVASSL